MDHPGHGSLPFRATLYVATLLMGFRYQIIPERNLIAQRYSGAVSLADVMDATRSLWADPAYDAKFDVLCDLSDAKPVAEPRDVVALRRFLESSAERLSTGRVAAIIRDPLLTALTMIYAAAPAPHAFRIFSTEQGACRYLELDVPPIL